MAITTVTSRGRTRVYWSIRLGGRTVIRFRIF